MPQIHRLEITGPRLLHDIGFFAGEALRIEVTDLPPGTQLTLTLGRDLDQAPLIQITGTDSFDLSAAMLAVLPEGQTCRFNLWRMDADAPVLVKRGTLTARSSLAPTSLPVLLRAPEVTGQPVVGAMLTLDPGDWGNADSLSQQWLRGGVAVIGQTGLTYTVTEEDTGQVLAARVTASNTQGTSQATALAGTAIGLPVNVTQPQIDTPDPVVGHVLSADPGGWTPVPDSYSYQWQADGTDIAGATLMTLVVTEALLGTRLSVIVAATNTAGTGAPVSSAPTAAVQVAGLVNTDLPELDNNAPAVGDIVTTSPGAWTPTPDSYSYQWRAEGTAIAGATSASFEIGEAQVGAQISVLVTAANSAGSVSAASVATAPVTPGLPVNTLPPAISGDFAYGETLTLFSGAWEPVPDSLTLQWTRDGDPITGATGASHFIGLDDTGKVLGCIVTAGNAAGTVSVAAVGDGPVPDITAPLQMGAPVLTPTSPSSMTVGLSSAPDDGGAPITGYDLRYSTDETIWTTLQDVGDPVEIAELAAATTYYVQSRAGNVAGAGPWSVSGTATTLSATTAVSVVAQAAILNTSASASTYSADFAVQGGADHALVLVVQGAQSDVVTSHSATANGFAMTQAAAVSHSLGGSRPFVAIYVLTAPPVGTVSFLAQLSTGLRSCTLFAFELTGVAVGNPVGSTGAVQTDNANPTVPLTATMNGSLLIGAIATRQGSGAPFAPEPGVTEVSDTSTGSTATSDHSAFVGYRTGVSGLSVPTGATPANLNDAAQVAVEIRPG